NDDARMRTACGASMVARHTLDRRLCGAGLHQSANSANSPMQTACRQSLADDSFPLHAMVVMRPVSAAIVVNR
uniref:hypothetical protein n=1 Tax=Xanthomonas axonopodis TaxID=53413 RepID=UPI0019D24784